MYVNSDVRIEYFLIFKVSYTKKLIRHNHCGPKTRLILGVFRKKPLYQKKASKVSFSGFFPTYVVLTFYRKNLFDFLFFQASVYATNRRGKCTELLQIVRVTLSKAYGIWLSLLEIKSLQ